MPDFVARVSHVFMIHASLSFTCACCIEIRAASVFRMRLCIFDSTVHTNSPDMLDTKLLRDFQNMQAIAGRLSKQGYCLPTVQLMDLEKRRKIRQSHVEYLRNQRNVIAKAIGHKKAKGEPICDLLQEAARNNQVLEAEKDTLLCIQEELLAHYLSIPNIAHASVPVGEGERDNQEIRKVGKKPELLHPKDHVALGTHLKMMDFAAAAKLSGSRFVVLSGHLARLQRALAQFMLDIHTQENGYTEVYVPYLVQEKNFYGTGQLPKFREDQFFVQSAAAPLGLIPTAEVSVTNLVRECVLPESQLPQKRVACTPCFRKESGSYGKDTQGMIRNHQFEKVELVQIVHPDASYAALEELLGHAEGILQRLDIPYRVMALCTGDLGFSAAKTYDIEVWLPGQNRYREISSCSNFEAFQARRMQARFKQAKTQKNDYVHTLNGSALALGRTVVAILENYQDTQGRVRVPDALVPYMGGMSVIEAPAL